MGTGQVQPALIAEAIIDRHRTACQFAFILLRTTNKPRRRVVEGLGAGQFPLKLANLDLLVRVAAITDRHAPVRRLFLHHQAEGDHLQRLGARRTEELAVSAREALVGIGRALLVPRSHRPDLAAQLGGGVDKRLPLRPVVLQRLVAARQGDAPRASHHSRVVERRQHADRSLRDLGGPDEGDRPGWVIGVKPVQRLDQVLEPVPRQWAFPRRARLTGNDDATFGPGADHLVWGRRHGRRHGHDQRRRLPRQLGAAEQAHVRPPPARLP